ncbi:MAG: hypothetical protein U0791_09370 [Gemmataceae bacterium]
MLVSKTYDLKGGAGADVFTINDTKVLTGSIAGEADADTLTFSAFTTAVDATLTAAPTANGYTGVTTAGGIDPNPVSAGFTGIDTINGAVQAVGGTLQGRDATSTWSLNTTQTYTDTATDTDGGTAGIQTVSLTFTGFAVLQGGSDVDLFNVLVSKTYDLKGGAGADVFTISDTKALTGSIAGEADADTLTVSGFTTAVNATLTTAPTANGYTGTTSGSVNPVSAGFTGIDTINGAAQAVGGTLQGRDATSAQA